MNASHYFTFIEYGIVLICLGAMLLHKWGADIKAQNDNRKKVPIKDHIRRFLASDEPWDKEAWGKLDVSPNILIPTLEDFDSSFEDARWSEIKEHLVHTTLLPWARKRCHSAKWAKRNFVARVFLLLPLKEDWDYLLTLLHDHDFYIRMLACEAIGRLQLPETIEPLLLQMAKESPSARFMFRHVLNQMPYEFLPEYLKVYRNAEDDEVRISCLDLMTHRFYGNVFPLLHEEIHSPNPTIREMVSMILSNIHSDEAIEDLLLLLKDPEPSVRKAVLQSFGKLKAEKAFDLIGDALNDDVLEVRTQAALSLYEYGKKGIQLLELQDSDLNPRAHEVARFVLTLP